MRKKLLFQQVFLIAFLLENSWKPLTDIKKDNRYAYGYNYVIQLTPALNILDTGHLYNRHLPFPF